MKNTLLLLTASAVLFSCKKDSDSNPSPSPSPTNSACVLTEGRDSVGNKLENSYEYDASRRISKIKNYSNGSLSGYSTWTYNGSTVTVQDYNSDNTLDGTPSTVLLNSSGYVIDQKQTKPDTIDGVAGIAKDTLQLSYNSTGQMSNFSSHSWTRNSVGDIIGNTSYSIAWEYSSGRVSKSTITYTQNRGASNNSSSSTSTYTYGSNSPTVTSNPVVGIISIAGSTLFGKLMSDKIPEKVDNSSAGQTTNNSSIFTATVDSKGNPTKIRTFSDYGGGFTNTSTRLYTYSCP